MHSTVTKYKLPRLLGRSQSKNDNIMQNLHPHLQRPKIYFRIGFGWNTDRLYDQTMKNRKQMFGND
jgi:hypothetical protein